MNYDLKQEGRKFVIGMAIKTSNENGRFQREVPPFLEKFHRDNMVEKIPQRKNKNLLAVYTEYEGDYMKPFTYIIGCEVDNLNVIPEGMVGLEIPSSSYAIFTAKGPFPQSIGQTWYSIWNSNITRSYQTDFEVYGPDFNPEQNPEVKIFISVRQN